MKLILVDDVFTNWLFLFFFCKYAKQTLIAATLIMSSISGIDKVYDVRDQFVADYTEREQFIWSIIYTSFHS